MTGAGTAPRERFDTKHLMHAAGLEIAEARRTATVPHYGRARDGCTLRSGAPTSIMVQLVGEKRWRRLMVWQFANAGTCFLRVRGEALIVHDADVPEPAAPAGARGAS